MVNVSAYLGRIGYKGATDASAETLRAIHRAHMLAVPFENLDIHLGRKIVCDESRFVHKIVSERRGGFCYELNGAFAALLRELGFQVTLLSARVARPDGTFGPDFDHLALRVEAGADGAERGSHTEESWLADVGFGDSFLEPLLLEPDVEQAQDGRVYRLMKEESIFYMEVLGEKTWKRQYSFTLEPRQLSEYSAMCHFHQTSPESHFTRQRLCSRPTLEGRVTLSDLKLIERRGEKREERELSGEQEWRVVLRQLFDVELPV